MLVAGPHGSTVGETKPGTFLPSVQLTADSSVLPRNPTRGPVQKLQPLPKRGDDWFFALLQPAPIFCCRCATMMMRMLKKLSRMRWAAGTAAASLSSCNSLYASPERHREQQTLPENSRDSRLVSCVCFLGCLALYIGV